ncbi:helicase [Aureococcus anophagefferens]|uniref:ATP-dependent RNA helicase n=1 Tax=Aureococcus anophagefferens TaxID=44056 RepID=A0ABR1FQS0_AURAN
MTDSFTFNFVASGAAAPRSAPKKETKKERKARAHKAHAAKASASGRPTITIKKGVVTVKKAEREAPAAEPEAAPAAAEAPAARPPTLARRAGRSGTPDAAPGRRGGAGGAAAEARAAGRARAAFAEAGYDDRLAAICSAPRGDRGGLGLAKPTEVQTRALLALRSKKDALLVAPTGSGKTLAYALPVLEALAARKKGRGDGAGCLVLAPTRELCLQIADVVEVVARKYDVSIVPGAITGGERRKSEKARLRKGLSLVVATPGRLLDHLKSTACLKFDALDWLVFDEVDRLLDMGFGPQIDDVIRRLGAKTYVTVLVTATITAKLADLAKAHLGRDHALVEVAKRETAPGAVETIAMPETLAQSYAICTLKLRLGALAAMLRDHPDAKTLVFVSTCASAEFHADLLNRPECRRLWEGATKAPRVAGRLHGNMKRDERRGAYVEFCRSGAAVLVATDVAARGLDFDAAKVEWVVQLDAPRDAGTYVHRCGRAGRAGNAGSSTLVLLPSERPFLDALARRLRAGPPRRSALASKAHFDDAKATAAATVLEKLVAGDDDLGAKARDAFSAHVRAYASSAFRGRDLCANQIFNPTSISLVDLHTGRDAATDDAERDALHKAFHIRKIHLGHCAKAFGLRETPAKIAKRSREDRDDDGLDAKRGARRRRAAARSGRAT